MKALYLIVAIMLFSWNATAQDIFGKWMTVDENGIEKSIVNVYKKDDKVYGKIVGIVDSSEKDALCEKCQGDDQNKPILGLEIIKGLIFDGTYYRNGTIFDPEKGKSYKCRLSLDGGNPDVLEVRGYIAFMHQTQYWKRIK